MKFRELIDTQYVLGGSFGLLQSGHATLGTESGTSDGFFRRWLALPPLEAVHFGLLSSRFEREIQASVVPELQVHTYCSQVGTSGKW